MNNEVKSVTNKEEAIISIKKFKSSCKGICNFYIYINDIIIEVSRKEAIRHTEGDYFLNLDIRDTCIFVDLK
jgi:hypothetical protein